jgi:hypothetical protein
MPTGSAGQAISFQQQHVAHPEPAEMAGDAKADGTTTDYHDLSSFA